MKRASVVVLALLDRGDDVGGGFVGHALEARERLYVEPVDVGRRVDESRIHQLIDQLLAQALDVHRAAAREMQQRLLALGRAEEPTGAARNRLVSEADDRRAAFGALGRHHEGLRVLRAAFRAARGPLPESRRPRAAR